MDFKILSKHDDILASYFLDNLYLWFTTVRMNSDPIHATGEQQMAIETIQQIVSRPGSPEQSIKLGVKLFLEFPYFKDYISKLSLKEARYFHQHLRRYILMFSHQAGFEVSSTTRYTGTMEACILATRDWTAGETVQCCSGAIVDLTKEDDAKLKSEGRDFSVMVSTRKKCTCLFLGPARFMNHDCDANCEFTSPQLNTISFKVQRDICRGEEMTVYYGDHYFGIDNCECRCLSCERMQEGSFRVEKSDSEETEKNDTSTPETPTEDENTGIRRSGRVKKEVDYVYKDVLSSPKRQKATLLKANKEESPNNTIPLVEITNGKSLEDTIEDMTIDDLEEMEINHRTKMQKPVEMDLSFICNEQPPSQWPPKAASPHIQPFTQSTEQTYSTWRAYQTANTYMNNVSHRERSLMSPHPPPTSHPMPVDSELVQFYEWLDDLSDVSDTEGSVVGDVNAATCCPAAKEYKTVITSTGRELCSRCYRHYKIYELDWPLRKKPIVVPPPSPAVPAPPASPPVPSTPSAGGHTRKDAVKPAPRSKSKSQPKSIKPRAKPLPAQRAKPLPGPGPKLLVSEQQQSPNRPQYHSYEPQYPLPPDPPAPFGLHAPQPPLQAPQIDPVIAAFALQSSHNYSLTSLPASPTFTPELSYASSSPSSRKLQIVQSQKVYAVHPRPI
ncbi:Homeobox protein tos8 [Mucor velutinosus]|uniref:Homeobox protein tos8 n=1 Tax=Mucor velutinosus TaxID=708070 RepID=A0AAN7DCC2_9FUNG|nr:Homeobox protein tos8 [Mucor velutinosus]